MMEKEPNDTTTIGRFFYEHPAIAGTVLYVQVTTVGVAYSWSLFRRFDINIFDYAETNDFLLAAFKNPMVFIMTFVSSLAVISIFVYSAIRRGRLERELHQELEWRRGELERRQGGLAPEVEEDFSVSSRRANTRPLIICAIGVILYTLAPPYMFASFASEGLLSPEYQPLTSVQYRATSSSDEQTRETGLRVIGTTQSFGFFYDRENTQTLVIPTAQIVEMQHDGPKGEPK